MPLPLADTDVIRAAARGELAAWDELVAAWLPFVVCWCRRLGGRDLDVEDVVHDIFLQVFDDLKVLRDPVAFPAWLYRITRGQTARARARAQRRQRVLGLLPFGRASTAPAVRDVGAGDAVIDLLQQLPEEQREVLVLCHIEEHTREEVAELLQIPVGTVKSRLRLATARFRTLAEAAGLLSELEEVGRWPH